MRRKAFLSGIYGVYLCALLVAGEAIVRVVDGYDVFALRLDLGQLTPAEFQRIPFDPVKLAGYFDAVPRDPTVRADLHRSDPPYDLRAGRELSPFMQKLQSMHAGAGVAGFEYFKAWNANFFAHQVCKPERGFFRNFPAKLYVFDSGFEHLHPRYRYFPSELTPSGLYTNEFGWRGQSIAITKPRNTIRIAFVGASTTISFHGIPYSYPELIGAWLNIWAAENEIDTRFEVINAAREGISSTDIAAIVAQEIVPAAPDYIVYYEGSNQFDHIRKLFDTSVSGAVRGAVQLANVSLQQHSAAWRRALSIKNQMYGSSLHPRGKVPVNFPADVDEFSPDLDSETLPLDLVTVLDDLDRIGVASNSVGAQIVLLSFIWLPHAGMRLDPVRHAGIHQYIDEAWHPLRYEDIERMASFQNRVFRDYALRENWHFVDLAASYPRDPDLFVDAIHQSYGGVQLRAWHVFNALVRILRHHIATQHGGHADQVPALRLHNLRLVSNECEKP